MMTFAYSRRFVYLDELSDNVKDAVAFATASSFSMVWFRKFDGVRFLEYTDKQHQQFKSELIANHTKLIGFDVEFSDLIDFPKLISVLGYYKAEYVNLNIVDRRSYIDNIKNIEHTFRKLLELKICLICPMYWWLYNIKQKICNFKIDAKHILNFINVDITEQIIMPNSKNIKIIDTADVMPGKGMVFLGQGKLDLPRCMKYLDNNTLIGCSHSMPVGAGKEKINNMNILRGRLDIL